MKLILVRHGETFANKIHITQGQTHGKLNSKGKIQSNKLARRLSKEHIDYAYVSDLGRAAETAEAILKCHPNIEVKYSKDLRERSFGIYDGKHQDTYRKVLAESGKKFYLFKPKSGESHLEAQRRIKKFYRELLLKHKDETVLIVSHGSLLGNLYLYLFRKSYKEYLKYHPENAALTILKVQKNKKPKVHILNSIKHLR